MGISCAILIVDFLFCYERDFMLSFSGNNQIRQIPVKLRVFFELGMF